jgi:GPI mannosyltransferase 3
MSDAPERRVTRVVLVLGLLAGGLARLWLALGDHGLYWPDEVHQTLEPAHRLAFGYGLVAWEYRQGARNWTLAGLLSGLMSLSAWLGLDHPRGYLLVVRLAFVAVALATALASYRLCRTLGGSRLAAACAAAFWACAAPAAYFGHRALSETAAALLVVLGFAQALRAHAGWRPLALGASLLGLATLIRLQVGVFGLALPLLLLARGRRRAASTAGLTLAAWAAVYGLIDRLTWGAWFHSAREYLRFNLTEGRSVQWGAEPADYYVRVLVTSLGPGLMLLLSALVGLAFRRAPGPLVTAVAFVALHAAIPHKELRFVIPALPLLGALAALGLDTLRPPRLRTTVVAAFLGVCALSLARFPSLTFGDLGQYEPDRHFETAYDDFGPLNRLLMAAHEERDLCGLEVEGVTLAWSGGYSHLHRRVPLYEGEGARKRSPFVNYVITREPIEGRVAARDGSWRLVQLQAACVADPAFSEALP